nr:hypothetical protein [Tanacetum cinerariifolium]
MKRVGTGLSRAITTLFGTMMVQVAEEEGDLPTVVQDTPIPDAPSSSQPQRKYKPRRKEKKKRKETEKLEENNTSLTKELKSFNSKVESSAFKETIMDKEKSSEQGRKITDINADVEVNLENVYTLDLAHER